MTILYTLNYSIAYCDDQTALRDVAEVTRQAAETTDEALMRGGIAPPEVQDVVELNTRVTGLENRVTRLARIIHRSYAPGSPATIGANAGLTQVFPTFTLSEAARVAWTATHRIGPTGSTGVVVVTPFLAAVQREPQAIQRVIDGTVSHSGMVDLAAGTHGLRFDATSFTTSGTWTRSDLILTVGGVE